MSEEKYGITDAHYLCDSAIFNTETNEIFRLYQICEILNQQDAKITDLEAKLAEEERDFNLLMLSKNEEINEWIAVRDDKNKIIDRQTDKIKELKQQLAEKEYLLNIKDGELNNTHKLWQNKIDEVKELKQQLAEKDLKITELQTKLNLKGNGTNEQQKN